MHGPEFVETIYKYKVRLGLQNFVLASGLDTVVRMAVIVAPPFVRPAGIAGGFRRFGGGGGGADLRCGGACCTWS